MYILHLFYLLLPFPPLPLPFFLTLPLSHTSLSVVVSIKPEIHPVHNISTYRHGSFHTVGCPVQTCAEQSTIQFLKGDTLIEKHIIRDTASVVNLALPITDTVTGEYACKVDTINPVGSDTSRFSVVGTLVLKMCFCHCSAVMFTFTL